MRIHYRKDTANLPVGIIGGVLLATLVVLLTGQWMVSCLVFAFGVLWSIVTNNDLSNPFEFDKLYLAFFFLYCVMPFIGFSLFPNRYDTYSLNAPTIWVNILSMVGLVFGDQIASRVPQYRKWAFDAPWNPKLSTKVACTLMLVGFALWVVLIQKVGLNTYLNERYVDMYNAELGMGYLTAGIFIFQIGIVVLAICRSEYLRRLSLAPIIPILILALFNLRIGRRGIVLSVFIALAAIVHFYYRPLKYWMLFSSIAALVLLAALVGFSRSFKQVGWEGMKASVAQDFTEEEIWQVLEEPNAVQLSVNEVVRAFPEQSTFRYGLTYLEGFEILIPYKLHPNRPLAPSQWFVWFYDPTIASSGGGYAFSMFAEGYMNFGWLGVIIVGIAEGFFVRRLILFRQADPTSESRLLIYAIIVSQTVYFIRGDFASFLKTGVVATFLPTVFVALFIAKGAPIKRPALRSVAAGMQ